MRNPHTRTVRLRLTQLENRTTPAVFTVTNLGDGNAGSLRDAIDLANAAPDADTIVFDPSVRGATVGLSISQNVPGSLPAVPQPVGPTALIVLTPITIQGTGETITRTGATPFRLFQVTAAGNLTLQNLTLSNGLAQGGAGGGGGGGAGLGGAIYNQGALSIIGSTLVGNRAVGGVATGNSNGGGGLGGPGSLVGGAPNGGVVGGGGASNGGFGGGGTTFNGNGGFGGFGGGGGAGGGGGNGGFGGFGGGGGTSTNANIVGGSSFGGGYGSTSAGGPGAGMGGAVFNQGGTVSVANSTLTENVAEGGASATWAGSGYGGGIFNLNGVLTLLSATLAGNAANGGAGPRGDSLGGALISVAFSIRSSQGGPLATTTNDASVTIANCIVANNGSAVEVSIPSSAKLNATGPNIMTTPYSSSNSSMSGTPFTVVNPNLGPLRNNGGFTFTMAPNAGSPAIDAGSNAAAAGLTADQRGGNFVRVINGAVDLGAVEVQSPPLYPVGRPLAAGGLTNGSAVVLAPGAGGQFSSTPVGTLTPFGTIATTVRVAVGDVNGDGTSDTILVTGPGTPLRLAVISGKDNSTQLVAPFDPFGGDFTGGGFVTAGDLDGDGRTEFVVSPDQGGGPRVTIFSLVGTTATVKANFFGIDDPNFRGGARAAIGDINGDGTPDLAVAAGFQGGPRTALFNGTTLLGATPTRLIGDFFGFPGADATTLRNGVFLSLGDVDGDGRSDLILGGGPGGGPRVFILSGAKLAANDVAGAQAAPIANYFVANNSNDRGGARVAAKNADGDAKADVVVGSGEGSPSRVRVYLGKNFTGGGEPSAFQDLDPFAATLAAGVFVG